MSTRSLLIPLVLVATSGTACVLPDDMSQIQQDMTEIQQRLRAIEREQQQSREQLVSLETETRRPSAEITREDLAEIRIRLDQIERNVRVSGEQMVDINRRLDSYSQELAQTRAIARSSGDPIAPILPPATLPGANPATDGSGTSPRPAPPGSTSNRAGGALPDPETLYNTAYTDFSKGNYALAVAGFEEYQELFPESALADNALYWIGECRFSQGEYRGAVEAFDMLLDRYPRSDKAPAGNLKKALAFLEQNQVGTAIIQLRYVIRQYPGTDEARIAEEKLSSLGATPA